MGLKEKLVPLLKTFWWLLTRLRGTWKGLSGVPFHLAYRELLSVPRAGSPAGCRLGTIMGCMGPSARRQVANTLPRFRSPSEAVLEPGSVHTASSFLSSVFAWERVALWDIRNFCFNYWSPVSRKQKVSSVKAGILFLLSSAPFPAPEAMSVQGGGGRGRSINFWEWMNWSGALLKQHPSRDSYSSYAESIDDVTMETKMCMLAKSPLFSFHYFSNSGAPAYLLLSAYFLILGYLRVGNWPPCERLQSPWRRQRALCLWFWMQSARRISTWTLE